MRNYFTISPKKLWQYTDNREKECVESHDCLHPEVTGHKKKRKGKEISAEEITTGKMRSFLLQTKIVNSDGIYN